MGHSFSLAIKSLKKEFRKRTSVIMQSRKAQKEEETTNLTAVALYEDEDDPEFITAPFL